MVRWNDCPTANDEIKEKYERRASEKAEQRTGFHREHSGCDLQIGTGEELCCCRELHLTKAKNCLKSVLKRYCLIYVTPETDQKRSGDAYRGFARMNADLDLWSFCSFGRLIFNFVIC